MSLIPPIRARLENRTLQPCPLTVTMVVYDRGKQALGHQAYLVHVSRRVESRRALSPLSGGDERPRARDKRGPARVGTWTPMGRLRGTRKCQKAGRGGGEGSRRRRSLPFELSGLSFSFFIRKSRSKLSLSFSLLSQATNRNKKI